jgi:hypothetical protein
MLKEENSQQKGERANLLIQAEKVKRHCQNI